MAAITLAPTPPTSGLGRGFWIDFQAELVVAASALTDSSNYTSANTVAEVQTVIATIISKL